MVGTNLWSLLVNTFGDLSSVLPSFQQNLNLSVRVVHTSIFTECICFHHQHHQQCLQSFYIHSSSFYCLYLQGDSGSALVCRDKVDDRWHVLGVVSWGASDCLQSPTVFTKVSSFITWAHSIMLSN